MARSRIGDMIRAGGQARADSYLRGAEIQGNLAQNLASIAGQTITGIAQARAEDRAQAEQKRQASVSQQIREALKLTRDPETGKLDLNAAAREVTTIDPVEGIKWWAMAADEEKAKLAADMKTAESVARAAKFLLSAPEPKRPQLYAEMRQSFAQSNGVPLESIPEMYDEQFVRKVLVDALPFTQAIEEMGQYAKELHDTDGIDLDIEDEQGNTVRRRVTLDELQRGVVTRRAKKEEPKTPTSFEAAILKARADGDTAEVDRLLGLQARFEGNQRAPRDPNGDALSPRELANLEIRTKADVRRIEQSFTSALRDLDKQLNDMAISPEEHSRRRMELESTRDTDKWEAENILRRARGEEELPAPRPPVPVRRVGAPLPSDGVERPAPPLGAGTAAATPPQRGDIRLASPVPPEITQLLANEPEGEFDIRDAGGNLMTFRKLRDGRIERVK